MESLRRLRRRLPWKGVKTDMSEMVLTVNNLKKLYKNNRGVKKLSLEIEKGDVIGLLGPNGSGKTTALKTIVGLCHADEGEIEIFGHNIDTEFEKAMENVGALIETPAIYDRMTAYQNLKMAARFYYHIDKSIDEDRINEVLSLVNLDRYSRDKAGKFSLGMRQRLGIALALLSNPKLVILDEPTNGLDIEGVVHIRNVIKHMSERHGTTFLVSGHVASELEKICNKVAVIYEGELKAFETMENVLDKQPSLEEFFLSVVNDAKGDIFRFADRGNNNEQNIG